MSSYIGPPYEPPPYDEEDEDVKQWRVWEQDYADDMDWLEREA